VQGLKILITPGTSYIHENKLFGACCEKEKILIVEHEVTVVILKTKSLNKKNACAIKPRQLCKFRQHLVQAFAHHLKMNPTGCGKMLVTNYQTCVVNTLQE
jgi:hypothetical protein